jgi:hypothetical protein
MEPPQLLAWVVRMKKYEQESKRTVAAKLGLYYEISKPSVFKEKMKIAFQRYKLQGTGDKSKEHNAESGFKAGIEEQHTLISDASSNTRIIEPFPPVRDTTSNQSSSIHGANKIDEIKLARNQQWYYAREAPSPGMGSGLTLPQIVRILRLVSKKVDEVTLWDCRTDDHPIDPDECIERAVVGWWDPWYSKTEYGSEETARREIMRDVPPEEVMIAGKRLRVETDGMREERLRVPREDDVWREC